MDNDRRRGAYDVLKHPEFRYYIFSRFFFILVITMQSTLISWKVYDITKDPFSIGLIGLVEFIPAFAMAFYAGHVIDRSDKKKLLFFSIAGNLVLTIILAITTTDWSIQRFGQSGVLIMIYVVIFFIGIMRAFSGPTSFALVSQLIPREKLPQAITWHSGSWQIAAVSGPAIAGLLYGKIGVTGTFDLMIFLLVISLSGTIFISRKPPVGLQSKESIYYSIREGFRFVWKSRDVLGTMSLDLFAVFFGGATALLPYYADVVLKTGPEGLGMLRSAPAMGSLLILLLVTFHPLKKQQGKVMLYSVAGFGAMIILFGISQLFWLSMFALFISGVLDGISVIVRSTILQLKTPDEMRGRVASLNSIFIMSSNELGAFESGLTSRLFGVVPAVVFGGCMTLVVTAITWFKAPELKKLDY
jgi:MFS family permease